MLQQILNDMYIDPELLAELDEDQKQVLFCKMREEQIRRWKVREDQLERINEKKQPNNKSIKGGCKKVTFLVGVDGDPVVVLMGGGGRDESEDSLLQERARRQLEQESDMLKRAAEEELDNLVRLSRSAVQAMEQDSRAQHGKTYDGDKGSMVRSVQESTARDAVVRSLQEATAEMERQIRSMDEPQDRILSSPSSSTLLSTSSSSGCSSISSKGSFISLQSNLTLGNIKTIPSSSLSSSSSMSSVSSISSTGSTSPSPLAFSIQTYNGNSSPPIKKILTPPYLDNTGSNKPITPGVKPPIISPKPSLNTTDPTLHKPLIQTQSCNSIFFPTVSFHDHWRPSSASSTILSMSSNNSSQSAPMPSSPSSFPSPTPVSSTMFSLLHIEEKTELEIQQEKELANLKAGVAEQIQRWEQLSEGSLEALKTATLERAKNRRQKEILDHLRQQVEVARQQVVESATSPHHDSERDNAAWQEQEKKAKEAEQRIREIARRAREEHRRASVKTSPALSINHNLNSICHNTMLKNGFNVLTKGLNGQTSNGDINGNIKSTSDDISNNNNTAKTNGLNSPNQSNNSGCIKQRLRPPKPPTRDSIVSWFREEELSRGSGLDHSRMHVEPWFHGIISRIEAEDVLSTAAVGSFLVRVSERIWGYAISYRASDRCRHYLIDVTGGKYTFFGSHQQSHETLGDLINTHMREPITSTGGELLIQPCGQVNPSRPDHLELFTGTQYLVF